MPFELDYYEVTQSLCNMLILVYNKLFDCATIKNLEKIDKYIFAKIIEPLSEEIC